MKKNFLLVIIFIADHFVSAQTIPTSCFKIGGWDSEYLNTSIPTYDGNYVMAGQTYTWNNGGNELNVYIVKCDFSGNIIWTSAEGTNGLDYVQSIIETSDHSLVLAGSSNNDMLLVKYSADGILLWSKRINVIDFDEGLDMIETSDGGLLISGETEISNGARFSALVKVDTDGNLLWNRNYTSGDDTWPFAITETSDHRYVAGGEGDYPFLFCVDQIGNLIWGKQTTNGGVWYDAVAAADNGVVFAGDHVFTQGDASVMKLDNDGDTVWSSAFGGSLYDVFYSVDAVPDGGFVMAGKATNFLDTTYAYVAKCDDNGQLQWSRAFNGTDFYSVHALPDGGFVACGDRDEDFCFVKLDANGNSCPDCAGFSYGSQHQGTAVSNITFTEHPQQATISSVTFTHQTGGDATIFCNDVGIETAANENSELRIFPDPSDDHFTIQNLTSNNSQADLFVMDEEGRVVMKVLPNEFSSEKEIEVNTSLLSPSPYVLVLKTSEKILTQKFVVQH